MRRAPGDHLGKIKQPKRSGVRRDMRPWHHSGTQPMVTLAEKAFALTGRREEVRLDATMVTTGS